MSKKELRRLIIDNKIKEVLEYLIEATDNSEQEDLNTSLILLFSRYNGNEKKNMAGVLRNEHYSIETEKIKYALTEYLKEYKPPLQTNSGNSVNVAPPSIGSVINPKRLFVSFHPDDIVHAKALGKNLALLKKDGYISTWDSSMLQAGQVIKKEVSHNMEQADIFLLLLTASYLAEDSCFGQLTYALERLQQNTARTLPIYVNYCAWQSVQIPNLRYQLNHLQMLPANDGIPISDYSNKAKAYHLIEQQVRQVIQNWQFNL